MPSLKAPVAAWRPVTCSDVPLGVKRPSYGASPQKAGVQRTSDSHCCLYLPLSPHPSQPPKPNRLPFEPTPRCRGCSAAALLQLGLACAAPAVQDSSPEHHPAASGDIGAIGARTCPSAWGRSPGLSPPVTPTPPSQDGERHGAKGTQLTGRWVDGRMDRRTVLCPRSVSCWPCGVCVCYWEPLSGQSVPGPSTHLSRWGRRPSPRDCHPLRCPPSWPLSLGGCGLCLFLPPCTASRRLVESCGGITSLGLALLRPAPREGAKDQPQPGTGSSNAPKGRGEPRIGWERLRAEQPPGEGRRNTVMRGITCPQHRELSACGPAACGLSRGLWGRPARALGKSGQAVIPSLHTAAPDVLTEGAG